MDVRHGGNIYAAVSRGQAWQSVLDFSASINPLGPPECVREAILANLDRIVHYPERSGLRLRERLAVEWGVGVEKVLVGNGATELLFDWCRWVGTGTIAAPAFGEFHRVWPDAKICSLAMRSSWPKDGPVVLTRPANPTGTLVDANAAREFAAGRDGGVLVDESFLDFCADAQSLVGEAGGNLFVLRSLTKFWALPGLRVGALVGDVEPLRNVRAPWTLNVLGEAAALAALEDQEHARRTRAFVKEEATWLADRMAAIPGLQVWPCVANYLYVETELAADLTKFAAGHRVLIRDCSGWPGLPAKAIRVAVRRRWENEILVRLCEEYLCD